MNLVDAFLLVSGISYIVAATLPEPLLTRPPMDKLFEVAIFAAFGLAILGNLIFFKVTIIWALLGIMEVIACGMTFLGYQQWNVLWKTEASDAAQLSMWAWDLMIAVCCFMKIPFTF